MTTSRVFFLCYYGYIFLAFQVTGKYAETIQVPETYGEGKVLLNDKLHTNCTVTSLDPGQKEKYVAFNEQNSMVILKELDLEVLKLQGNSTMLTVHYMCDSVQLTVYLNIIPVNEFDPIFLSSPYSRSILEGNMVGKMVIFLGNKWSDEDRVKYGVATIFSMHPYIITAFDGREYFKMDKKTGNLTTSSVFDYEKLLSRKYFMLNVSVEDDGGRASFTTVNVTIQDIDDNPPIFTSCEEISDQCHVTSYTAIIDRFFQGSLPVSPWPILAKDLDTGINDKILYTIDSDDEMAMNIQIDSYTGGVEVNVPFVNFTNWTDAELRNISLQVTATEDSSNSRHTNISLTVLVYRELPTTTSVPATSTTTPPSSSISTTFVPTSEPSKIDAILLVEIIVPVCVVVVIVVIIICVFRNRKKKQRDSRYKLRESQTQKLEKLRKSESFEPENIDVISSTPINPYELISMYARMDSDKNSKDGSSNSSKEAETAGKATIQNDMDKIFAISTNENEAKTGDLYAKVDKRKPRRRQKQALDFTNNAMETNEEIEHEMDSEATGPDSEVGQYSNISETNKEHADYLREFDDNSMVERDTEADRNYITADDVNGKSEESPDISKLKTGDYSSYENVDLF